MISRNWLKSVLARMSQTQFRQRSTLTDSWMEACRILCVDSRLEAQVYMGAHCSFLSPPWCGPDSSTSSYYLVRTSTYIIVVIVIVQTTTCE